MKKVAVVLYGFLRTYETTAKNLIKNILEPNNADLFIFTYNNEGISYLPENMDINQAKCKLSISQDLQGKTVTGEKLFKIYGKYLKDYKINHYNRKKFLKESKGVLSPFLPIERFYSLYYNISEATKLLLNFCKKHKVTYDAVILTRPDLNFYSSIDIKDIDLEKLNIPKYGGNIKCYEKPVPYYTCYYKNVERGEYIPWQEIIFSDQLIVSSMCIMRNLSSLYASLKEYNEYKLPVCHPETILYYHLAYKNKIEVKTLNIFYEILRSNFINATNEMIEWKEQENKAQKNKNIIKREKYKDKLKQDLKSIEPLFSILKLPFHYFKYRLAIIKIKRNTK